MDDTLDLSRWREAPRGVGYRRGVIVAAGIRQLVATRFFKILIYLAWFAGILIAVAGFAFSQSLAEGGWLDTFAQKMGPRAEALFKSLSGLIALYPDIVISGFFTLVFWIHSFIAFYLSTIALSVLVPQLITRDRASNAMIVYLSRPITSFDYLLGKLGTITGVLLMMWTGPLLLGWLLSMVLSSDREFIQYSFTPLLRALSFNGIALLALAPLALGVSALSNSARAATAIWMALWLLVGFIANIPDAPAFVRHASFSYNLSELRQTLLGIDDAFAAAASQLPILSERVTQNLSRGAEKLAATHEYGALIGLGVLGAASCAVFFRKIRPE